MNKLPISILQQIAIYSSLQTVGRLIKTCQVMYRKIWLDTLYFWKKKVNYEFPKYMLCTVSWMWMYKRLKFERFDLYLNKQYIASNIYKAGWIYRLYGNDYWYIDIYGKLYIWTKEEIQNGTFITIQKNLYQYICNEPIDNFIYDTCVLIQTYSGKLYINYTLAFTNVQTIGGSCGKYYIITMDNKLYYFTTCKSVPIYIDKHVSFAHVSPENEIMYIKHKSLYKAQISFHWIYTTLQSTGKLTPAITRICLIEKPIQQCYISDALYIMDDTHYLWKLQDSIYNNDSPFIKVFHQPIFTCFFTKNEIYYQTNDHTLYFMDHSKFATNIHTIQFSPKHTHYNHHYLILCYSHN